MSVHVLLDLLSRLKDAGIYYDLSDPTEDAIMVEVSVPGEKWEIEVHRDGRISVESFVSSHGVQGPERLDELFRRFSD